MNKEERVKLVFETISKIAGFEIKPNKAFYMIGNIGNDIKGAYNAYKISESLNLYYKTPISTYRMSNYNISSLFNGEYQLEEIQEPLLTEEEKEFLRYLKFEKLAVVDLLYVYSEDNELITVIDLNNINLWFDRLEANKKYSREELGL